MGEALTEEVAKGRQVEEALSLRMVELLGSARRLVKPQISGLLVELSIGLTWAARGYVMAINLDYLIDNANHGHH